MGIDDIFIGFVISYIAGQIPSLKELFKKEEDNSVQEHINKCYEKALKKWCANDSIRQRVARLKFSDVNQLSDFATNYEGADALALGFVPVSLGSSRLRTETAGVVACHTAILVNE